MTPAIQLERLLGELDQLASFTDATTPASSPGDPQRAVTRLVFTQRDLQARAWLKALAEDAGLDVRADAVGNTFFRWAGSRPDLAAIATGSHVDAIPHAGMYDGTVGVLGGLEAVRALKEAGFRPQRSVELVLLTSEEPTRFGIGCLGSRLLAGVLDPELADALPDRLHETDPTAPSGGTLRSARTDAGFTGPLTSVRLPRSHYAAWLELHIEQGPLLERAEAQDGPTLGVVTAIAAPASYRFTVVGVGGHAGALLMPDRRDALCAAGELILAIEEAANAANRESAAADTVATVGTLAVHPGAVNAVPSRVTLGLDLRDTDAARRGRVMASIRLACRAIEARRGVQIAEETINEDQPTLCDPALIRTLAAACSAEGVRSQRMVSRAYHDTSFMAHVAPSAMLFLPCRAGVSHRPDEYATPEAIARGARVLARALAELATAG